MTTYGLIGYPLSHSFSKKYFTEKFEKEGIPNHQYDLFPLEEIDELTALLKAQRDLAGLNVTIPYKQKVMPFLKKINAAAAEIGAVNTIKILDGELHGFNTDAYGFQISLQKLLNPEQSYQALIFGTGGASKAIQYILKKLNITFRLVSRHKKENCLTYEELSPDVIASCLLLVNTTPLGMSPNVDTAPNIPYQAISQHHILYDLVYNPEKTLFLKKGIEQGATSKNGLEMLHLQAEKSWEIWNT